MNNKVLTAEYKHFDNLIWQLPVWSTAIFLLAVTAVAYISQASFENLTASKALIEELPTIFCTLTLLICCVFQLATFNALIRFRDHQAKQRTYMDAHDLSSIFFYKYSDQRFIEL